MTTSKKILEGMRRTPGNVRSADLFKVCVEHFGDSRVNIREEKGKAKAYQVRQVLQAIDRLKAKEAEKAKRGRP
jgi:hypothetical protein